MFHQKTILQAKYGSRGLDGTCLAKVKMWYEGLKFLWEPESSCKRHHTIKEIDTDDPEIKKEVFVNRSEVKTDILETNMFVKLEQDEKSVYIGCEV